MTHTPYDADREVSRSRNWIRGGLGLLVAGLLLWFLMDGRQRLPGPPQTRVITLYSLSIMEDVVEDALLPAFRQHWLSETGEQVEIVTGYAGSGDVTRKILSRYPADVAILASEIDAYRLANWHVAWEAWRHLPHRGILAKSPLVIVTRAGNPHTIAGFADLSSEVLDLVYPDPATSGCGSLAVIATWAPDRQAPEEAEEHLRLMWAHSAFRERSARSARNRFAGGSGDALVTYEQDVLSNPARSAFAGEIVYPVPTLLAEIVVVRLDKNIDDRSRRVIDAFLDFLWTEAAQELLVEYGFRSVDDELSARRGFPPLRDSLTLDDLGGAVEIQRNVLDALWQTRILATSEESR